MEETTTIIKAISEYGILLVIAGIFLITYWLDRKDRKTNDQANYQKDQQQRAEAIKRDEEYRATIKLLADSTNNVAKALDLLRVSEDTNTTLIRQHDQRSIDIKEDIQKGFGEIKNNLTEVKTIVSNCRKK